MKYIVGLGNPKEEFIGTRHNIGRDLLIKFAKKNGFDDFVFDKKIGAQISEGKIGKEKAMLILPDTYMNKSGLALKKIITNAKKALDLLVIHDDLDMGLGTAKIVFNKGVGGHRGVLSIVKSIKTEAFPRIKIGISPMTSSFKIKKPSGEDAVIRHVLGKFSKKELDILKKIEKKTYIALERTIADNYVMAMNEFNQS